jgi:GNAT superfamily N-acetyltransferase
MVNHMTRHITLLDLPVIIAFQHSLEAEGSIWGYKADSLEDWANRDLRWTLLETIENKPVGFIHCIRREPSGECVFPKDANVLEIMELFVAQNYRDVGIGQRLVSEIKAQAVVEGFTHLRLYSAARRFDDIVKFYRNCGFDPWYLEMTQDLRSHYRKDI